MICPYQKMKDEVMKMNIETANRLLQYRKQAGLSQEELAEKIGVSRQAVSKWERSEASPDTDNLVEISKIYGVSLDEMLGLNNAKEDEETKETETYDAVPETDEVHVSFIDGVRINSKDGDKVNVSFRDGVHIVSKGDEKIHINKDAKYYVDENGEKKEIKPAYYFWLYMPFPIIITALFLGWGFSGIWGGWSTAWLLFLLVPFYYSIIEAVRAKDLSKLAFPVIPAGIFVGIGMFTHTWHPTWIVFLTIPVFYCIVDVINKNKSHKQ